MPNNTLSDACEQGLLRQLLIGTPFTDVTPVKLSLHTADPTTGDFEVTGGSYARLEIATDKWTEPVGIGAGSASFNTDNLEFTGMPETTVTHIALWSNDGTIFLMSAPLDVGQFVSAGATFTILAGHLQVRLN